MTNSLRLLPPLNALRVFEAAYRHQSFTRAADELALSQASVSRRIRELELDLGVSLFERRRYDVLPTNDGEMLATSVRPAFKELAITSDRLRNRSAGQRRLTIFSDLSLAGVLITPFVGEFQRLHSNLELRILTSLESIETVREDFDIGIQYGRWAEDKFDVEAVADDAIFPVCSPEFAKNLPSPFGPIQIAKQPLLHLAHGDRKWPDWRNFLAFFRLKEPKPIERYIFNSYQICLDVAEEGEGIALGWARSVKARLENGRLVRLPGMTMPLIDNINIYRFKNVKTNPVADEFLQLIRDRIESVE